MDIENMSVQELIDLVGKIDQLTIECEMLECFSASEELNEMAAEIRMMLEEKGIEI